MTEEINEWWEETWENYQNVSHISTGHVHWGVYAPTERQLNLLGDVKGKRILEIGCGGGQCSIAFTKQGARCTALDQSAQHLEFAKQLAKKENVQIDFKVQDVQTLEGIPSDSFDIVFSAYALQYIPDLATCFKEVHRVLKPGGIFAFSYDHPFYTCLYGKTGNIVRPYKDGRIEIEVAWKDGNKHKFIGYMNKISTVLQSLKDAGLTFEQLIEPFDEHAEQAWRDGFWKDVYPPGLVKMVQPTIIFKARK